MAAALIVLMIAGLALLVTRMIDNDWDDYDSA